MSVARHLGNRLREHRLRRGWTQQELADRAGLSLNAINSYERAERFPRAESLDALLEALAVDPVESPGLLGLADEGVPPAWPSSEREQALASLQAVLDGKPTALVVVLERIAAQIAPHFGSG